MKAESKEDILDSLIGRSELAYRWRCHPETVKRMEKAGHLHPVSISTRMIRYEMSEVLAFEHEAKQGKKSGHNAGSFVPAFRSAADSSRKASGSRPELESRRLLREPSAQKHPRLELGSKAKRPNPAGVSVNLEVD